MFGLATMGKDGKIFYIERLTRKNATTSRFKFDARRFFSPGEAEFTYRQMMGDDVRIFSKPTSLGTFIVEL